VPRIDLVSYIPAFRDLLSDADILAVMAFIKRRWPLGLRVSQAMLNPNDAGMPPDADRVEWRLPPTCIGGMRRARLLNSATLSGRVQRALIGRSAASAANAHQPSTSGTRQAIASPSMARATARRPRRSPEKRASGSSRRRLRRGEGRPRAPWSIAASRRHLIQCGPRRWGARSGQERPA
jgi:hypothetical protein